MLSIYWNDHAKHQKSALTTISIIEKLTEGLGTIKLMDLDNARLIEYRAKRRADVIAQTVNRDIATLQAALNYAANIHSQPIPRIAWKTLKVPENPHRIRFLSRKEYDKLMEVAHASIRPIIAFAVFTGLRKDNILSLTWSQVDMTSGWVTVILKGNKRHSVRLSQPAKAVLSVLPKRTDEVFATTNFRKRWYKAVEDAELADFRFHDLRHTFASWARQAGADLADICDALGHSNISVTMKYAHIKTDEHVTAFDRLASAFTSHSTSHSKKKTG